MKSSPAFWIDAMSLTTIANSVVPLTTCVAAISRQIVFDGRDRAYLILAALLSETLSRQGFVEHEHIIDGSMSFTGYVN